MVLVTLGGIGAQPSTTEVHPKRDPEKNEDSVVIFERLIFSQQQKGDAAFCVEKL